MLSIMNKKDYEHYTRLKVDLNTSNQRKVFIIKSSYVNLPCTVHCYCYDQTLSILRIDFCKKYDYVTSIFLYKCLDGIYVTMILNCQTLTCNQSMYCILDNELM